MRAHDENHAASGAGLAASGTDAQKRFLHLALVVAKHNARFRVGPVSLLINTKIKNKYKSGGDLAIY